MKEIFNLSTSQYLFLGLIGILIIQRLLEMYLSNRNETWIKSQGGQEHGQEHFIWMKVLHTSWFIAMPLEVILRQRTWLIWLGLPALLLLFTGQLLRYAAITTLGKRWTVRIFTLPEIPAVSKGIFKYFRHPNYLGVILEIAAVPLIHTAWITSIVFSLLNAWLLKVRIKAEEKALSDHNQYQEFLSSGIGLSGKTQKGAQN